MKKCLRQKCQKEFEPNKPKQVFCSAKCRVYFSREKESPKEEKPPTPKNDVPKNKGKKSDVSTPEPKKGQLTAFEIYQRTKLGLK